MIVVNNITTYRPPVHPPNGTRKGLRIHPSQGGNAYAPEFRDQVISTWQNGGDLRSPVLEQLWQQRTFLHINTCNRWIRQYNGEDHTRCMRPTGNHISQREIHGQNLVNLAIYRMVRPKAYIDEARAYVHNQNAYFQLNLFKRQQYWHAEYPDGTLGESTRDVIDLNESNYKLETQTRKFSKVVREKRCNTRGKYKKGEGCVSLLMAISGDEGVGQSFSFHRCYTEGGTDLWRFFNFMLELCDWLDAHRPGRSFLFTMDNSNIHKHPVILDLIHGREHHVIFRAPYWSCDGAIEYVFNTLQTRLQMDVYGVDTVFDLVNKINTIIGGLPLFKRYFLHVGFPDN